PPGAARFDRRHEGRARHARDLQHEPHRPHRRRPALARAGARRERGLEAGALKIAVLGGGHGAYAAATDLSEQGHEVRLWRRDAQAFAPVLTTSAITLTDERGTRPVKIARLSTSAADAVRGAELVLIPGPANSQADITRAIAPALTAGQVVFMPPGTFGSYAMANLSAARGVLWAETGTLPY